MDASIVDTPLKPKGKPSYKSEELEDSIESPKQESSLEKQEKSSVDTDASWTKKLGKLRYGY